MNWDKYKRIPYMEAQLVSAIMRDDRSKELELIHELSFLYDNRPQPENWQGAH